MPPHAEISEMNAAPTYPAIRWVFPRLKLTSVTQRMTLGRGDACSVVLRGQEVSRRHAIVEPSGSAILTEDVGSRNGTFVNGRRITMIAAQPGAILRLGDWIGIVQSAGTQASPELAFTELAHELHGSAVLARVLEQAERCAIGNQRPIVIEGETGTGKKLVARAIHGWSARPGRFVVMNCAAVPAAKTEAELFGYLEESISDTACIRAGRLRAAHRGTLLLEEIASLSLPVQQRLVHALKHQQVVGPDDSEPTSVEVRVIAATHEPFDDALEQGRIAAELHELLNHHHLKVPPLRDRVEDVPPLFLHFVRELSLGDGPGIDPRMIERLCLYDWPYNVQELRTLTQGLLSLYGHRDALTRSVLPSRIMLADHQDNRISSLTARGHRPTSETTEAERQSLTPSKRSHADEESLARLVDALRFCRGNLAGAASMIGMSINEADRLLNQAVLAPPPAKGHGNRS